MVKLICACASIHTDFVDVGCAAPFCKAVTEFFFSDSNFHDEERAKKCTRIGEPLILCAYDVFLAQRVAMYALIQNSYVFLLLIYIYYRAVLQVN